MCEKDSIGFFFANYGHFPPLLVLFLLSLCPRFSLFGLVARELETKLFFHFTFKAPWGADGVSSSFQTKNVERYWLHD